MIEYCSAHNLSGGSDRRMRSFGVPFSGIFSYFDKGRIRSAEILGSQKGWIGLPRTQRGWMRYANNGVLAWISPTSLFGGGVPPKQKYQTRAPARAIQCQHLPWPHEKYSASRAELSHLCEPKMPDRVPVRGRGTDLVLQSRLSRDRIALVVALLNVA
jgi:hypothetical protein